MDVEVALLGSPSLISLVVCVAVKATLKQNCTESELRSCVKVEVAILGPLSLICQLTSEDIKHQLIISFTSTQTAWIIRYGKPRTAT